MDSVGWNLDNAQRRWLVYALQCLGPQRGRLKGWWWLNNQALKSKSILILKSKSFIYLASGLGPSRRLGLWTRRSVGFVCVQWPSHIQLFATPWTTACQAPLSSAISHSLLKFMSIESVMLSNHLILCHPLPLLPSIFASIRIFSNELALHIRWAKNWSFSFIISPFNEYSGLISFWIDWFDLLAVQGTLESLLQHHNSKASDWPEIPQRPSASARE